MADDRESLRPCRTRDRLRLYFDGGCRPNPGPMETAVVVRGMAHVRTDLGTGDNNEAEWLALIHAAELARAAGATDVLFVGDAMTVVQQALGAWRCRSAHLMPYLSTYRTIVAGFARVHLRQVRRSHNLAGIALDRRRAGLEPSGSKHAAIGTMRPVRDEIVTRLDDGRQGADQRTA